MKNAKVILPVTALVLGASVLYASSKVSAFGFGGNHESLVQTLAQRFGKSEDEVQSVFDEIRADHHAQMQASFEERLDQAVTGGEISNDQKQLILEKHEELQVHHQAEFENKQDMTKDEWRELRQSHHDEMEVWAEENGIDIKYFFGGYGEKGGMMGHGGRGMHGDFAGKFAQ